MKKPSQIETFILESLREFYHMVRVNMHGLMEQSTRGTGKKEK